MQTQAFNHPRDKILNALTFMRPMNPKLQIGKSVVILHAISMMDGFIGLKKPTKVFLHDYSMLKYASPLAVYLKGSPQIPVLCAKPFPLSLSRRLASAFWRAVFLFPSSRIGKLFSALLTDANRGGLFSAERASTRNRARFPWVTWRGVDWCRANEAWAVISHYASPLVTARRYYTGALA